MLKRILFLVFISVSHLVAAQESQDESGVRGSITFFSEAWNNTHNPKTMASYWTEDADLINPWGKRAKNRQEIEQLFSYEQTGPLKESVIQQNIEKVRFLTPNIAWVDSNIRLTFPTPNPENKLPLDHHVVFLVVKRNGKWLIASARPYAFMNSDKTPQ